MRNPKAGGWIAGTAFVGVLILVVAWFTAISPTLATASETRQQAEAQENQNQLNQVKIANLKKQFAKLDEIKAQLAAVQLQIPTKQDLAVYQQQLASIAAVHEVTVVSVNVSASAPVVPVLSAAEAKAAADAAAAAAAASAKNGSTSDGETSAPATPAAAGIAGFSALSSSFEVMGTYQNVLAFLQDLQTGTQRLFLVTGLAAKSLDDSEASGGKPATARGDLDLAITGNLYVLTDTTGAPAPAPTGDAATPPVLPVPDPAKNPFAPLG